MTLICAAVLQSGHVVYRVLYHQLQVCHCILKKKRQKPLKLLSRTAVLLSSMCLVVVLKCISNQTLFSKLTCVFACKLLSATLFGPGGREPNAAGRSFKVCTSLQST